MRYFGVMDTELIPSADNMDGMSFGSVILRNNCVLNVLNTLIINALFSKKQSNFFVLKRRTMLISRQ